MYKAIIVIDDYEKLFSDIANMKKQLMENGNLFIIVSTEYHDNGNVKYDFLDIIEFCVQNDFKYINTIVYPSKNTNRTSFIDNVRYLVWLCKDHDKFVFNKDSIREKHIWKDIEWGKREKNYNPKGKDPGNVWIPTEDDGKANITKHILIEEDEVLDRLMKMSEASENEVKIYRKNRIKIDLGDKYFADNGKLNKKETKDYRVYFGTSENMCFLDKIKIKTCITSPPYWDLKDYYKKGQIGQESYEVYIDRLKLVWKNVFNLLAEDGSLWINVNIRTVNKNPILIPKHIINSCKEIGYSYKGIIIWHKSSGIPRGNRNIADHHEYLLLFSKNDNYKINFRENMNIRDYKNNYINNGGFWNINRKAGSIGKQYIHPAIYPVELVDRVIRLSSNKWDYTMDPFLGSGTSLISAKKLNRNFIGFEYYEGFKELMGHRFKNETNSSEDIQFIMVEDEMY